MFRNCEKGTDSWVPLTLCYIYTNEWPIIIHRQTPTSVIKAAIILAEILLMRRKTPNNQSMLPLAIPCH